MSNEQTATVNTELVERMFQAGAHFGYSKTRRHPSTAPFIFGAKNRVEIFDLEKTSELLERAVSFAEGLGRERKDILFVGGKNEARGVVARVAADLGLPYVSDRWIGGSITNFPQIQKRIARLRELTDQRERGELTKKYTKLERLMIDREIERLEDNFGGLRDLEKLPAALFVIDTKREHIAAEEARKAGIPIIGLANSDCNLREVDYPIVGNDAAMASISFFVGEIADAWRRGRAAARQSTPAPEEAKQEADAASAQ